MRGLQKLRRTIAGSLAVASLAVTGMGYWQAHGLLGGITVSQALGSGTPHSAGGSMNVLLIGLDSRKDQDGNDLPESVLEKLHAGDSSRGGYNTNTLILVHIDPDGRTVAFSIPRDDYVAVTGIDGYDHAKIKEVYGLTKAQTEDQLEGEGVTDATELEQRGREAGRAATLGAVRDLTGQPIDYFAEVNLAGFYDLAQSLGGVRVCLNNPVYDDYSGADFPAGAQTLNAEQALAFVRQRHGLKNGDLDRTHRQQAFLLSVMHSLEGSGTFRNLDEFRALTTAIRKDVVLSQGWGEQQFRRMAALTKGDVRFQTLPVVRYDDIDGQDVNIVDPEAIRATIAAAIDGHAPDTGPATPPGTTITVVNAGDTVGLAAQTAELIDAQGFTVERIRDRQDDEPSDTTISYGPAADAEAIRLAQLLGTPAPQPDDTLAAGQIRVVLGPGYSLPSEPAEEPAAETPALPKPDAGPPVEGSDVPCVD